METQQPARASAPAVPPLTRDTAIAALLAAGQTAEAGRRRRKADPKPRAGFRVLRENGGTLLVTWVPAGGVNGPAGPALREKARQMAAEYATVLEAAGWHARPGGIGDSPSGWHWVQVTTATAPAT